jgi:uncharacterized membrane protein YphA (DoxX/SURF4 family)
MNSSPNQETHRDWEVVSTPRHAVLGLLGFLGGAMLGLVLLVAAWLKALDPAAFAAEVERQGLDFLLPATAVAIAALAIEVLLGTALLLGMRYLSVLLPSAALVVFFLVLTGRTYYQDVHGTLPDDEASCGCFGNLVDRTPAEAFWQDLLLMVPALLIAFLARPSPGGNRGGKTLAGWPPFRSAVTAAATLAVVVVAWKAPELPLDNLATRLKPGVAIPEHCVGSEEAGSRACIADVVPELAAGEHVVILADLEAEVFTAAVEQLNEYQWVAVPSGAPKLWTLHSASEEALFQFQFGQGPAFDLRETPAPLMRPLYRTLPRSFLVRDGRVVDTWAGLPPLDKLGGKNNTGR